MREIEILVELKDSVEKAKSALQSFEYVGAKHTVDTYYFDPKRKNLKLNENGKLMECCRLREKDQRYFVTYKMDNYNGDEWIYSDEYESEVKDIEALKKIFECLGLEKLVVVDNTKHIFKTPQYEVVVEEVKELGNFLEVEALVDDQAIAAEVIKKQIYEFIISLGLKIGAELNSGKPELLMVKKNK